MEVILLENIGNLVVLFSGFFAIWGRGTLTPGLAGLSLLALGVYTAKRGTGVAASYVEARLGKPSLVRDTSRFSAFEVVKHPINTARKLSRKPQDALSGVVLEPGLEHRLRDVALATKNTKLNNGLFRNLVCTFT